MVLEKYKQIADELSSDLNIEKRQLEILFPLIEDLGYSDNSLIPHCIIGTDLSHQLEYGLIKNPEYNTFKLGIKIVKRDMTFNDAKEILDNCLKCNPGVEYGVVTDGIVYDFYQNVLEGNNSQGISFIQKVNLCNPTEDDESLMRVLSKREERPRQQFIQKSFEESEPDPESERPSNASPDFSDWDEDSSPKTKKEKSRINNEPDYSDTILLDDDSGKSKKKRIIKNTEPKPPSSGLKKIIMGIITAFVIALIIWFCYDKFIAKSPSTNNPTDTNQGEDVNWGGLNVEENKNNNNTDTSLQFIKINAVIGTRNLTGDNLELTLLNTNILEKAIIKFEIICGTNRGYAYATIDKKGECKTNYQIPATWSLPDLAIVAYIRFDEIDEYEQPKSVKEKYGENGEHIIRDKEAPQYGIAYTYTTHENEAVVRYINENNAEKNNAIIKTREMDFANVETLNDIKGNIKHVPSGFSLTEANITENRNVYPMIYYDSAKNKSYFNLVAGYLGRDWTMFESVIFKADTYEWGYEIGSNDKQTQLGGKYLSEWVYFNDFDNPTLLADMNLLANSNDATVKFNGPRSRTHKITEEEKQYLKFFLYMYETYYGNGTKIPSYEWFEKKSEPVDLNYLVLPQDVRERNSSEILEMEETQASIASKRSKGQTVSPQEQSLYEQMQKTYKPVDMNLFMKIFTDIKSNEAVAVYDTDREHGSLSYMKLYLYYDNKDGTIESGYIPYIIIYSDKSIQIPLLTTDAKTNTYEKTLIEGSISQELYNELVNTMESQAYVYYSSVVNETQQTNPS